MPIELPSKIGQPARRALAGAGVTTLEGVTRFSTKELLALHGLGPRAIRILGEALDERAMNFANQDSPTG